MPPKWLGNAVFRYDRVSFCKFERGNVCEMHDARVTNMCLTICPSVSFYLDIHDRLPYATNYCVRSIELNVV